MQDIFEQVDEQLEMDRVQKWWEANRKWLIAGLVFFFILLFAYVGWRDYQLRQDHAASEQFMVFQDALGKSEAASAQKGFDALLNGHPGHGYAQFGRFLEARALAAQGNREGALAQLALLVKESGSSLLVDLALLNAAYLTVGEASQAESFLARMNDHSPYRAHALELQGLLAAQRGDPQAALERYREAHALAPEGSLRSRLESRLERLGGEEKK